MGDCRKREPDPLPQWMKKWDMEYRRERRRELAVWVAWRALGVAAVVVPVLLISIGPPTFDEAVAAYEHGDYATAYRGFLSAAEQGNANAQVYLGFMYDAGEGVSQDDGEAVKWWRRAAEQGDADAQRILGTLYREGEGVPQDYDEAVKWYRRAAEQGDADAQFSLGAMYSYGEGIPQDYGEAVKWFRRAAEQGDAFAQFYIGFAYHNGKGVPQDYGEAVKWYRRAAEQGNVTAQLELAYMYINAEGVSQDYIEAAKWQRHAAEQGNAMAQLVLGLAYRTGEGVRQDHVRAHMWLDLAVSSSTSDTGMHEIARDARDAIANLLTADELARARRMAREWRPGGAGEAQYLSSSPDTDVDDDTASRALVLSSAGTGIRVSTEGHILTAADVVEGCAEVRVPPAGAVAVIARNETADLALLKAPAGGAVVAFRQEGHGVQLGAAVMLGSPLRAALASGTARVFLDSEGVAYKTAPSDEALAPDEVTAKAAAFTVLAECWN